MKGILVWILVFLISTISVYSSLFTPRAPPPIVINNNTNLTLNYITANNGGIFNGIAYFNAPVFFRDNVTIIQANSLEINHSFTIVDYDGTIKIILNASGNSSIDGTLTVGNIVGDGSQLTGITASSVEDVWVNTTGDTMTGDLFVSNSDVIAEGLNASYIYSFFSNTAMDIRADPWGLIGAGIQADDFYFQNGDSLNDTYVNIVGDTMIGNLTIDVGGVSDDVEFRIVSELNKHAYLYIMESATLGFRLWNDGSGTNIFKFDAIDSGGVIVPQIWFDRGTLDINFFANTDWNDNNLSGVQCLEVNNRQICSFDEINVSTDLSNYALTTNINTWISTNDSITLAIARDNIDKNITKINSEKVNITTQFGGDVSGTYNAIQVETTQGLSTDNITSGTFDIARIPQDFNNTDINTSENIAGLGFITTANGSIWNVTGNNIYPSDLSVSVGIGTASPSTKLEVSGTITANDLDVPDYSEALFSGLVGHWTGDGHARDLSGYDNDGTLYGNTNYTDSVSGKGFEFDGVGDYVDVGNDASLNFGNFTDFSISGWFKTDSTHDNMWIVAKGFAYDEKMFGIRKVSDHKLHFRIYDDSTVGVDLDSDNVINDGVWHHVVAVANRSGNATMYIDGNLQTDSQDISLVENITHTNVLNIGKHPDPFITTHNWNGTIDEVLIFNRSLSATEIQALYLIQKKGSKEFFVPYTGADKNIDLGANNFTVDTNVLSVDSTNDGVGIGTTAPGYKLDIDAGTIGDNNYNGLRIVDQGWTAVSHPMLEFYNSNAQFNGSLARIYGEIGNTGTNSKLYFAVADSSKSLQDRMVIDKSGNVGIGTASPSQKLDIVAGGSGVLISDTGEGRGVAKSLFFGDGGGTWTPIMWGVGGATGDAGLHLLAETEVADDSGTEPLIRLNARQIDSTAITTRPLLAIENDGSQLVTVDKDGNVGIGNNSPQHKLSVNGDIYTNGTVFASGINITSSFFALTANENNSLRFTLKNLNDGSGAAAVITAENNVGGTMSIGVVSENYMIGDMSYPNATTLISRSKGDMAFVNSYDKAFFWLYNPSDDNDLNNLVEIMKLDKNSLNVSTNITAQNVFLPQYIYSHNNETISVLGASTWTNVTFTQEEADIKLGISHTYDDNTNTTFTFNADGVYYIHYEYDVIDTSASSTDIDVAGRVIWTNGTEIPGSVFETDITKKLIERELAKDMLANLRKGDKILFQVAATDADVVISTHGTFGEHPESVSIIIEKRYNLP